MLLILKTSSKVKCVMFFRIILFSALFYYIVSRYHHLYPYFVPEQGVILTLDA